MDMENKFFDSNFFGIGFSALSSDLGKLNSTNFLF
jgi:hypothetical protein